MINLVGETIKSQLQPLLERIKTISEENKNLRGEWTNSRLSLGQITWWFLNQHLQKQRPHLWGGVPTKTSFQIWHSQSRYRVLSKLGLEISANDITAGCRISGPKKTSSPIVVGFATRIVRDRVNESRKSLRKQEGATKVYINEHLTRTNSEIFAAGRKLFKDRKLSSIEMDMFT